MSAACSIALLCLCLLSIQCCQGLTFLRQVRLKQMHDQMLSQDPTQDRWIEQRLDNFHYTDYRVWNQRYFMSDAYTSSDGPVFLQIGGEGPANPIWMSEGHWIVMAKQVKALCFMIEHRFYGKSHPTSDLSVSSLAFLSSEQALADIANFISNMTSVHKLQGRKWFVFGGSYSGALSIWARLKYPHLVAGAVSASAPLHAVVDFTGYLEVVENSLHKLGSPTCADNLRKAADSVVDNLRSADGRDHLFIRFRLCERLSANGSDNAYLQESLAGNVMEIVQYNRDNRAFEGGTAPLTISNVCAIMDNSSIGTPMDRYAVINSIILDDAKVSCMDPSYTKYIAELSDTTWSSAVGGRPWVYQTCAEFGWYQSTDSTQQPFLGFDLQFSLDQCQRAFGIAPTRVGEAVRRSNEMYGGRQVAHEVSNVTLYNGGIDPWANVSYVEAESEQMGDNKLRFRPFLGDVISMEKSTSSKGQGIVSLPVPDHAHCAIMYPASPKDSPKLTQARLTVEKQMKNWLGL